MGREKILETKRLYLRQMDEGDFPDLCKMLQDEKVMYAYAHAFSDEEARDWLNRQMDRYRRYGFGLWAVILKDGEELIGQCGLTMQECRGREVPEVGYLFRKEYWHRGYAIEAASACRDYAFRQLDMEEVYSIIRDSNLPSRRVALQNGMTLQGQLVKHYYGMDMPHDIYRITREAWAAGQKDGWTDPAGERENPGRERKNGAGR